MSIDVNKLKEFGPYVDARLSVPKMMGLTRKMKPYSGLVDISFGSSTAIQIFKPKPNLKGNSHQQRLQVLEGAEDIKSMNTALAGGQQIDPVLSVLARTAAAAMAGSVIPAIGTFVGLVLGLGSAVFQKMTKEPHLSARKGDEVWLIQEIGTVQQKPMYVLAIVLRDPFRGKEWIIHYRRSPLTL